VILAYDRKFNTPLVLFTAYKSEIKYGIPKLKLEAISPTKLGFSSGTEYGKVYNSGKNIIATGYYNNLYEVNSYDPATKTWSYISFTTKPIMYWGNGVFLWVQFTYVYVSTDGKDIQYAGNLPNEKNPAMCAASSGKAGVVSCWYVDNPIYCKDDISTSDSWIMPGTFDKDGICCFTAMTWHKGQFVGIASETVTGSNKGGIQISVSGRKWTRTIQYPYGHSGDDYKSFEQIRSVGGRLFLIAAYRKGTSGDYTGQFCTMQDGGDRYTVDFEAGQFDLPNLDAIVYVSKYAQFVAFGKANIYISPDGYNWEIADTAAFDSRPVSAVHIPGDGFYVSTTETVYYAACP
jgi:hypothetical protein